jgi:hypothetical protein
MHRNTLFTLCLLTLGSTMACADEGMWLFNDLPTKQLKARYGFEPTEEWAEHVRLSSVRFNVGGSGSFVSSTGLVLTNHHVASDTLFKLSNSERDVAKDGYLAKDHATELKAPDLELNVLAAIEDVTERVISAVQNLPAEKAAEARRAVMAEIEKESLDTTGLRSDVVTLFGGSKFHLYRYRKYTDVRLVWAPEADIAFFGGDADNFEYPRYCLDVTLFRVYEDGQPAKIEHHLKWADKPLKEEELIFVAGNPGRTQRLYTLDAFKYMRDVRNPYVLNFIRRKEVLMQQFGLGGAEQRRRAQDDLFGLQNSRKAYMGMLGGLQNPAIMQKKQQAETQLLAAVRQNPQTRELAAAWAEITQLQEEKASTQGTVSSFRSRLYDIAETLVLMAAEDEKPGTERLREFRESARDSLEQDLFSTAPIYPDLERVKLADELARLVEKRGGDDELVAKVLAGKSPAVRAAQLVSSTKLFEPETRKATAKGGTFAISHSADPLIQLAKLMEPELRAYRKHSEQLAEQERQAYAKISQATVAIQGTGTYPDATFTLRLAFGPVRSYQENGVTVPAWTTMGGAFQHETNHSAKDDWKLPQSWHDARAEINDATPFNFVCTADIIGGNSGSPVINRQAEFVGIIFDGNIQSLTSNYLYTDEVSRAVSVSGSAIREAMRGIYGAEEYANELGR